MTPRCGMCGLWKGCRSPKMKVHGQGRRGILVVGESPGKIEDQQGKPFVGPTGQLLQRTLRDCDVDLFRDCWVVNAARCHPPRDELPERSIDFCRPYVTRDIEELRPQTIILLGKAAVRSVLGALGRSDEDTKAVGKWVGWMIPSQQYSAWVAPTYHPSHVLRSADEKKGTGQVVAADFARHLKAACAKTRRPWKDVPDWQKDVQVVLDPGVAMDLVDEFDQSGRAFAFDYETSSLKPDGPNAEIVCCSISDGRNTVAFPWHGAAVAGMKRLLSNPTVKKLGWNAKFEHRWVKAKLGIEVKGWAWDGMLAAHCLDSRKGVTGLKFQAFARLGVPDYSSRIEPYLHGDGGNGKNRIREADITEVCRYCGMDSLLEFKLAKLQAKDMGVVLG